MTKHYVYCMDHDTGFAPNVKYGICTLTGCKKRGESRRNNIEENAKPGSWIIGIGGKRTNQPSKLIYAMQVKKNLSIKEFENQYPGKYRETLRMADIVDGEPGSNVLVSTNYYYFGDNAEVIPDDLSHIIYRSPNCKCISIEDALALDEYLSKTYEYGVHGSPNNPPTQIYRC